MIRITQFHYKPHDSECEKASNSYLMSLIALIAGMPLPIINLIATLIFFLANRKATGYVRWHCTQALLSQFSLLFINSYGFWWTMSIIFSTQTVSNNYIAYIITMLIANLAEFITTIYTTIKVRKGIHIQWWFYGRLTNILVQNQHDTKGVTL